MVAFLVILVILVVLLIAASSFDLPPRRGPRGRQVIVDRRPDVLVEREPEVVEEEVYDDDLAPRPVVRPRRVVRRRRY